MRYACMRSGVYRPQLQRLRQGAYVYLQHEARMTLDVKARHTTLWMKEMSPSGLLLLEDKDGKECHDHFKKIAPCPRYIKGTIRPKLAVMAEGFPCFVCGETKGVATMLLYDQCQSGWHIACLGPPLTSLPSG